MFFAYSTGNIKIRFTPFFTWILSLTLFQEEEEKKTSPAAAGELVLLITFIILSQFWQTTTLSSFLLQVSILLAILYSTCDGIRAFPKRMGNFIIQ